MSPGVSPDVSSAARNSVAAAFIANGFGFATFFSRVPDVRSELSLDNGALCLLLLSASAGSILALPLSGRLIERWGGSAVVRAGGIACALALLLRDQGLLSIDEPVARWLPELPASQGRRTLREFMSHTGGTRDYLDLSLISNGLAILPEDGAYGYQCRQEDENFAPGTRFIYNNGGYRMLSLIIERVLRMPLAQALSQHLFAPLSMSFCSHGRRPACMQRLRIVFVALLAGRRGVLPLKGGGLEREANPRPISPSDRAEGVGRLARAISRRNQCS